AQRARRDARQNRRLRGLLAMTAIFLVVALLAGLVARQQRDTASAAAYEREYAQLMGSGEPAWSRLRRRLGGA
ncbi:MAG: hypothetical protein ACRD0F_05165, partial [Acidimicrobiales bacterium]